MTKFVKENFYGTEWVDYNTGDGKSMFIARFKYSRRDKAGFISFLIKNFTVEEYQAEYKAGKAPLEILQAKGYVSATVKSLLKRAGYAPTMEGKRAYLDASLASRIASNRVPDSV